MRPDTFLQ